MRCNTKYANLRELNRALKKHNKKVSKVCTNLTCSYYYSYPARTYVMSWVENDIKYISVPFQITYNVHSDTISDLVDRDLPVERRYKIEEN